MDTRRKSTLFLVEQLIVIAVFALCAIACISILTTSYFMAADSRDTSYALIAAQNYAEAFKAANDFPEAGDEETAHISAVHYYDENWAEINSAEVSGFVLTLSGSVSRHDYVSLFEGEVTVGKVSGENLVKLPLAASRR